MFWRKKKILLLRRVINLNLAICSYSNTAIHFDSKFLNSHIYPKLYKDYKNQKKFKMSAVSFIITVY